MELKSTSSNRAGVVLGTPPVDQFPRTMTASSTASAATDALPLAPVEGAKNERIMGRLLGKNEILDVACWNVRTLLNEGSQKITMPSLLKYGVDIACLSEVRLPNNGRQTIMVPQSDAKYHLYHSGPEDNTGQHGVAIALSDRAEAAVLAWKPVNKRICWARFRGRFTNVTVISVYS